MGNNQVTNVANGSLTVDSTDAVNGSQLYATNQNVTNNTNNITNLTDKVNKGFGLKAQDSNVVNKQLGEIVDVIGGNSNITVVDNKVQINLNNNLDLGESGSVKAGNTTVNNDGLKINNGPSVTNAGIDASSKKITNVTAGTENNDAVNVEQLKEVNATANAGWKLTTNGADGSVVTPNATVDLGNTDGNIVIAKDSGNNVTFNLNDVVKVGNSTTGHPVTIDGTNGTVNGLTNTVFNPENIVSGQAETEDQLKQVHNSLNSNISTTANELTAKGLNFVGDNKDVNVHRDLGQTLSVVGGLNDAAQLTDGNIGVIGDENGSLAVKLAKNLTNLTSAVLGSNTNNQTVLNDAGITITSGDKTPVSLTDNGLDNGHNVIINMSSGLVDMNGTKVELKDETLTQAVNVGDLKDVVTNLTTGGFGLVDSEGNFVKQDLGTTIKVTGKDGINATVVADGDAKALQISLNSTVTVGGDEQPGTITVKGEKGQDGISINGKDGISIKGEDGKNAIAISGKDGNGAIAVNGKDGKTGVGLDGANGTVTVAQGPAGVNGKEGETMTRIVYTDANGTSHNVSTLEDGLVFVGYDGKVIRKQLNETLAIKGNLSTAANVTGANLRVDNVNGDLIIKMAQSLRDLTDATFTNVAGNSSVIEGNGLTITSKDGNKVSLNTDGLDKGGNKITNVSKGTEDTDAVNVAQLKEETAAATTKVEAGKNMEVEAVPNAERSTTYIVKTADDLDLNSITTGNTVMNNDGVKVGDNVALTKGGLKVGDTEVTTKGVKVGDKVSLTNYGLVAGDVKISAETGISAGDKQITKVASGLGDTKLADAKDDTLTNATNIGDLKNAVAGVTDVEQGGGFGLADEQGNEVKQSIGKTVKVEGDGNVTTSVVTYKDGNKSLQVGLNKDINLSKDGRLTTGNITVADNKVSVGNTQVTDKGVSFADSLVKLTNDGLDNGGKKATNVAAGELSSTSTDAVNGSQLYSTNQNVTNVQNQVAKGWNVETGTVEGSNGKMKGSSKAKVAMGDTVSVKAGNNIEITQDGKNIAIATSATPNFDTVTVGKGGNTATIGTITDVHGTALKVAGADGKSETRINNVADAKADNDAVNLHQLKDVAQNVSNLDNRVSKLDKRVRGIGANAAAASSLPQVYIPGKSMVAVAGGAYSGESAVAISYLKASDNGKVILKVNGSANSSGHYSDGVGVGYQW